MIDPTENEASQSTSVALCVGRDALDGFGRVLRHLVVGLVDQAVALRVVSSDLRVESLTLGPIQTLVHRRIGWPATGTRVRALLELLAPQPPAIAHAFSRESYRVAGAIAAALGADLVVGVTSIADCQGITRVGRRNVGRFLAVSEPLVKVLEGRLKLPRDQIELIRPGVLASKAITCFADTDRCPTILCTSPLERRSKVDRLLQATEILQKKGHALSGFLPCKRGAEPTLRRMVRERNLSSCVTFANPLGDPASAMGSADIFVRPSEDNAFSADALQAMGAGMAVVTGPASVCDYLRGGETAVVCDKATTDSLADGIEQLLIDHRLARRIAEAGLEYVREKHAMSGMAERTAKAYRQLTLKRTTFRIKE